MRNAIVFEAERKGYDIEDIANRAITVGELREILEEYEDDWIVVLSHDNGYTYGSINEFQMYIADEDESGDWHRGI